jgi:regulator of sigma E protease
MEVWIKAGEFLLAISILVIVHEFGHYIASRIFGIRVEKFFLFFDAGGFKLFSKKIGDTTYGIGWLPLGGYVKIAGMVDESMDKDFANSAPQDDEFRSKPAWQRLIVMLAGITMNVILGILIFTWHTFHYGEETIPISDLNNGIIAHSLAKEAGLKNGDVILKMNGEKLKKAGDIISPSLLLDDNVNYEIKRDGQEKVIYLPKDFAKKIVESHDWPDSFVELREKFAVETVDGFPIDNAKKAGLVANDSIVAVNGVSTPFFSDITHSFAQNKNKEVKITVKRAGASSPLILTGLIDNDGHMGFAAKFNFTRETYDLASSFRIGANRAWHAVSDNVKGLWRMITGALPAKSLHSLIGIANAFPSTWNWSGFWMLTGLLSMVLAFMNLLPIPALDGGHVIFLLVEMVRRKPVSIRVLEVSQIVGMSVLFLLMAFALYNDMSQFIFKR